jgi:transposase
MDNLGSHKRQASELRSPPSPQSSSSSPPYSPDLNLIEQVFAKLKTQLRKSGERPITATWDHVGAILEPFMAQE